MDNTFADTNKPLLDKNSGDSSQTINSNEPPNKQSLDKSPKTQNMDDNCCRYCICDANDCKDCCIAIFLLTFVCRQ
jgi:hypothetical protein